MAKLTNLVTGTASAISRLPSFLIGLAIIVVLAGGAYGAWRVVSHCSGQSLGECFLSAINPFDKSYGRGVGEPLGCADNEEMNAGLCYPKCQVGYKGVGLVCLQESCPSGPDCPGGMTDIGVSCQKPSHGRGVGVPIHACADDKEKDGLLCYPKCKPGFHGVGPVCWPDKA